MGVLVGYLLFSVQILKILLKLHIYQESKILVEKYTTCTKFAKKVAQFIL